jgi:hypothetical protein
MPNGPGKRRLSWASAVARKFKSVARREEMKTRLAVTVLVRDRAKPGKAVFMVCRFLARDVGVAGAGKQA